MEEPIPKDPRGTIESIISRFRIYGKRSVNLQRDLQKQTEFQEIYESKSCKFTYCIKMYR